MQSNEIKKLEQKLTQIQRQIDEKEFEKSRKKQEQKEKKTQRATLRSDDLKLTNTRNEVEKEIANINVELRKEKNEMSRLYADLVYKTRQEYEDMIKRYEKEMQFNNQAFRRHEETRILREIASLKNGITLLERYDQKKLVVTNLQETLQLRINEREHNWNQRKTNNNQLHELTKEINELTEEINRISNKEIAEMNTLKNEIKKKLEDLNRELNAKYQQQRKESLENKLKMKALKKDEILLSMEDSLRDLNKLINYFQKLIDSTDNTNQQQRNSSKTTMDSFSSSSSLNASNAQDLCDQLYATKKLSLSLVNDKLNTSSALNLSSLEISSSSSRKNSSNLSTPFASLINTPTNEQYGSVLIRKSLEDTRTKKQLRKTKSYKNNKVAHSVDIINLLSKMNVPIQLSSQHDECLKELVSRKEAVLCQMQEYASENRQSLATDSTKTIDEINNSADNFESNSLDSNYESDNNSVTSFQSSINSANLEKLTSNTKSICLVESPQEGATALVSDRPTLTTITTTTTKTPKIQCEISTLVINSDDSDATINESNSTHDTNKRNSIPRLLIRSHSSTVKIKLKTQDSSKSSSASSDSTTTPGSPKTPTPFTADKTIENPTKPVDRSLNSTPTMSSTSIDDSILNKEKFMRQLSDGYSSSNTPLSASSINNELPTVNPFFQQAPTETD